jgi:hypothetical protein
MATGVLGQVVGAPRHVASRSSERVFFSGMSMLILATILLGFRSTYFHIGARSSEPATAVVILHGIVFSLWVLTFFVQTTLVSTGRVHLHISLGLWAYALATAMVPLGLLAAQDQLRRDSAMEPPYVLGVDPLTFSMESFMGMVMFGTLIAGSYMARRQPAAHKRLALYATLSMMNAGISRWPLEACGIHQARCYWIDVGFLLLPVVYDLILLRRLHWVTMFAAPYVFVLNRLELPLGHTHLWHAVAGLAVRR